MIRRGEVRWYRFARPDKRRPVVVLTRDSAIEFLGEVTVAPRLRSALENDAPDGFQVHGALLSWWRAHLEFGCARTERGY